MLLQASGATESESIPQGIRLMRSGRILEKTKSVKGKQQYMRGEER
ncbi:MAG: hypothetical protein HFH13_08635 [Dorea sp.]|nr:hypothetical protein [Dorea sp.]